MATASGLSAVPTAANGSGYLSLPAGQAGFNAGMALVDSQLAKLQNSAMAVTQDQSADAHAHCQVLAPSFESILAFRQLGLLSHCQSKGSIFGPTAGSSDGSLSVAHNAQGYSTDIAGVNSKLSEPHVGQLNQTAQQPGITSEFTYAPQHFQRAGTASTVSEPELSEPGDADFHPGPDDDNGDDSDVSKGWVPARETRRSHGSRRGSRDGAHTHSGDADGDGHDPCATAAPRTKRILHAKFRLAVPRQFVERNFDINHVKNNGLTIQLEVTVPEGADYILPTTPAADAQPRTERIFLEAYHVGIDVNRQSDGSKQYRVLRFASVYRRFAGWQVGTWTHVDDSTARLTLSWGNAALPPPLGPHPARTNGSTGAITLPPSRRGWARSGPGCMRGKNPPRLIQAAVNSTHPTVGSASANGLVTAPVTSPKHEQQDGDGSVLFSSESFAGAGLLASLAVPSGSAGSEGAKGKSRGSSGGGHGGPEVPAVPFPQGSTNTDMGRMGMSLLRLPPLPPGAVSRKRSDAGSADGPAPLDWAHQLFSQGNAQSILRAMLSPADAYHSTIPMPMEAPLVGMGVVHERGLEGLGSLDVGMGVALRPSGGGGGAIIPPLLPGAVPGVAQPAEGGPLTATLGIDTTLALPHDFFTMRFRVSHVLSDGLRLQVQTGSELDPCVYDVGVANFISHAGMARYKVTGFKDVARKYQGWQVVFWDKVDERTMRMRMLPPAAATATATTLPALPPLQVAKLNTQGLNADATAGGLVAKPGAHTLVQMAQKGGTRAGSSGWDNEGPSDGDNSEGHSAGPCGPRPQQQQQLAMVAAAAAAAQSGNPHEGSPQKGQSPLLASPQQLNRNNSVTSPTASVLSESPNALYNSMGMAEEDFGVHAPICSAEVGALMRAGCDLVCMELPAEQRTRLRSVVSQNQSMVRPEKGRVYLQKPFVEANMGVIRSTHEVQVCINSGGQLDPMLYATKITLSSSGTHGKTEYLLRLTAPMKHAHNGQRIIGWTSYGCGQLLMHLCPPQPPPAGTATGLVPVAEGATNPATIAGGGGIMYPGGLMFPAAGGPMGILESGHSNGTAAILAALAASAVPSHGEIHIPGPLAAASAASSSRNNPALSMAGRPMGDIEAASPRMRKCSEDAAGVEHNMGAWTSMDMDGDAPYGAAGVVGAGGGLGNGHAAADVVKQRLPPSAEHARGPMAGSKRARLSADARMPIAVHIGDDGMVAFEQQQQLAAGAGGKVKAAAGAPLRTGSGGSGSGGGSGGGGQKPAGGKMQLGDNAMGEAADLLLHLSRDSVDGSIKRNGAQELLQQPSTKTAAGLRQVVNPAAADRAWVQQKHAVNAREKVRDEERSELVPRSHACKPPTVSAARNAGHAAATAASTHAAVPLLQQQLGGRDDGHVVRKAKQASGTRPGAESAAAAAADRVGAGRAAEHACMGTHTLMAEHHVPQPPALQDPMAAAQAQAHAQAQASMQQMYQQMAMLNALAGMGGMGGTSMEALGLGGMHPPGMAHAMLSMPIPMMAPMFPMMPGCMPAFMPAFMAHSPQLMPAMQPQQGMSHAHFAAAAPNAPQ